MRALSRRVFLCAALAAVAPFAAPTQAQTYPDHTVKIIVPFPAGGTADAVPRIVADWLSRKWGQPVVIENHTGAAGNIGSEIAYKAAPDGYTLLSAPRRRWSTTRTSIPICPSIPRSSSRSASWRKRRAACSSIRTRSKRTPFPN
jgi:tripartite-type tricarboxylate transporter receptor subunit TctC